MTNNTTVPPGEQWSSVPDELKKEKAWLLWEKRPKENKPGKFDKIPYYTDGTIRKGVQGSDLDRSKLATFNQAVKALNGRFAGIGIAALHGAPWAALDLDNIAEHPEASELGRLAQEAGAYVERSPSGGGLRAFIKSTGLGHRARHDIGAELFEDSGFVTVTGDVVHEGGVPELDIKSWFEGRPSPAIDRAPPPEWARFDLEVLPEHLRQEVQRGYDKDDDRSSRMFGLCIKLARAGLSAEEVYCILTDTNLPWFAAGLDRRHDPDSARDWVWRYGVQNIFAKEQARANERRDALGIGAGEPVTPEPFPVLTLEEMLGRFVYLSASNEVCDTENPRLAMPHGHFKSLTAASRYEATTPTGRPSIKSVADGWLCSPDRHVLETRTWRPGFGRYLHDPNGRSALNIWTPPQRGEPPSDWESRCALFLHHITYLVPIESERERFLDWLAHIAQCPGELVHSHYLFIAPNTQGIGRNWLASLLGKIWAGNTALSVDFRGIMEGAYNSILSEKVLAVVDELHEGGGGSIWAFSEALKTELTREHRLINPKYGRQHTEFNCLRWLMLSNSMMALPLTQDDRRFWVVENPTVPRDGEYYETIYTALGDVAMLRSVAEYLTRRDINRFKVGERPAINAVKKELITHTVSEEDTAFDRLIREWPSDLITNDLLQRELWGDTAPFGSGESNRRSKVMKMLLAKGRGRSLGGKRVDGVLHRVTALRNGDVWAQTDSHTIAEEVRHLRTAKY